MRLSRAHRRVDELSHPQPSSNISLPQWSPLHPSLHITSHTAIPQMTSQRMESAWLKVSDTMSACGQLPHGQHAWQHFASTLRNVTVQVWFASGSQYPQTSQYVLRVVLYMLCCQQVLSTGPFENMLICTPGTSWCTLYVCLVRKFSCSKVCCAHSCAILQRQAICRHRPVMQFVTMSGTCSHTVFWLWFEHC